MFKDILSDIEKIPFSPDHQPVLVREVAEAFFPLRDSTEFSSPLNYLDGTFGRGGHYQVLKKMFPDLKTLALDQDEDAINYAHENFKTEVELGRLEIFRANFSQFSESNQKQFDMILLDLGVSSPQLDEAQRGFSFYHQGPLDMRMNREQTLTAAQIINTFSEKDLISVFQDFGEIHRPHRVVRAVVHDRKTKAFETTQSLSSLIERVDGWRKKGQHPATLYFMALRLVVNNELNVLAESLPRLIQSLTIGGRLAVISFHSLEDRIVKNIFKSSGEWGAQTHKKVIIAAEDEQEKNPRSRSAKLRIFERRVQDELEEDPSDQALR